MERFYNLELSREELDAIRKDPKLVKVGMGGCYSIGSDTYAFEVVSIIDEKHIMCRKLDCKQVGDYFGNQKWEFYSNPEHTPFKMVFRDGRWREQNGRKLSSPYYRYSVGKAYRSEDPSF